MRPAYLLFPLAAVFFWSGNTIVTKLAAGVVHPSVIAFDRWALAFLILTPLVARAAWRQRDVLRHHVAKLAVLGFLGMAAYQGLAYYAALSTSATNMGIFLALVPLITLALGSVLLRERPAVAALAGGVLSLVGIGVLLARGQPRTLLDHGVGRGDGLMIVAVTAYAAYGVFLRRWSLPLPVWTSVYAQIFFGLCFLLPGFLLAPSSPLSQGSALMIVYAALAASIGAPVCWMQGVKHLGPARTSIFMNLMPVFTAILAAVLLSETLHGYHVVGGGLTLAGVILAQLGGGGRGPRTAISPVSSSGGDGRSDVS